MNPLDEIVDLTAQLADLCSTLYQQEQRWFAEARVVVDEPGFPFERTCECLVES